jgi:hypothetical protein
MIKKLFTDKSPVMEATILSGDFQPNKNLNPKGDFFSLSIFLAFVHSQDYKRKTDTCFNK